MIRFCRADGCTNEPPRGFSRCREHLRGGTDTVPVAVAEGDTNLSDASKGIPAGLPPAKPEEPMPPALRAAFDAALEKERARDEKLEKGAAALAAQLGPTLPDREAILSTLDGLDGSEILSRVALLDLGWSPDIVGSLTDKHGPGLTTRLVRDVGKGAAKDKAEVGKLVGVDALQLLTFCAVALGGYVEARAVTVEARDIKAQARALLATIRQKLIRFPLVRGIYRGAEGSFTPGMFVWVERVTPEPVEGSGLVWMCSNEDGSSGLFVDPWTVEVAS